MPYAYKWHDDHGGICIRECLGGIPLREVFLQAGDDANQFRQELDKISAGVMAEIYGYKAQEYMAQYF